jgi:hypothetical protein
MLHETSFQIINIDSSASKTGIQSYFHTSGDVDSEKILNIC